MSLRLRHEVLQLDLRDPFVIARSHGGGRSIRTVVVELTSDRIPGIAGIGEGYPDPYYGETPETMAAVFPLLLDAIGDVDPDDPAAPAAASAAMDRAIRGHGAAKCAVDLAVHDLVGQALRTPVVDLLGLSRDIPPTDFTLGLDEPAIVAERARRAGDFPALKIKVGGTADLATLEAVRAVYAGPLRVDANTGWSLDDAVGMLPALEALGVELIEQPFPARRLDLLAALQRRSPLPIVADESAVSIEDLDALVGVVAGVNVKLAKCGGIAAGRAMLERARELGFRTFLGCMEETSLGIAGAAALASLADWVDLDGSLLLADDPFEGLDLRPDRSWVIPQGPGLGVVRRRPEPLSTSPQEGRTPNG